MSQTRRLKASNWRPGSSGNSSRARVRTLAQQAEASDPDQLADAYCLMLEGMLIACRTYGCDSGPVRNATAVVEKFLRQNCGPRAFPPEPRRFRRW